MQRQPDRDSTHYALRKREPVSYAENPPIPRRRNPNVFPFGELPADIRNEIYALVVVEPGMEFRLVFRKKKRSKKHCTDNCKLHPVTLDWERLTWRRSYTSTLNLGLLRTCKWVWGEATPVLYGQTFIANMKVMDCFLSLLRPELLGTLREVKPYYDNWHDWHRLQYVMQYLVQATRLEKLDITQFPTDFYDRTSHLPSWGLQISNQGWFEDNVDHFNEQLARVWAFYLYRHHFGMWMVEVYRRGGIEKLSRVFVVKNDQIGHIWSYALGQPSLREYNTPAKTLTFWRSVPVWNFFTMARCDTFRLSFFKELDSLLSQRLRREESIGESHVGQRKTLRSWQAVDTAYTSVFEAGYLIQLP